MSQSNLLTHHTIIVQTLGSLSMPLPFVRSSWFMENCRWDVALSREAGVMPIFLEPLEKPVPMLAPADIGGVAAELLQG